MARMSVADLGKLREKYADRLAFKNKIYLLICGGTGCHATGSIKVKDVLTAEIAANNLTEKVEVIETGCNGFCAMGPIMIVHPGDIFYQKIKPEDVPELIQQQLIKGKPVERLLYKDPTTKKRIQCQKDIPFFAHQQPRALRNKGLIDPESLSDYIARDGYQGAAIALLEMTPDEIISEVKTSGLRGRGGAGFPTGVKWQFAKASPGDVKYVLCNADEGDPGAFMDRSILEADPHAVLEGMIIAAKAINATQGYIYARTEYPLAIKRLGIAIEKATGKGLLGDDILGSGFNFHVSIYQGAGAFVCGEETALMRSIEGKRGMPRPRPPFPAHKGLWEKPTILNNVESLANVPQIILNSGAWYANVGTESSKGTKVFALSGDVNNIGLVEVPMGTSLRKIIYDVGGGIPKKRKFKAVQLGGPSGGCVPEAHLDTPVDYEAIAKVGAIMGSGGVIVMDENTCMVDMARFFMDFIQDESCGKCTPCREGTRRQLEILKKICDGKGEPQDIDLLEELSTVIKETALCGLGQTAPNPVLSTLRYFRDEFEAHIHEKRCPAKRCVNLLKFEVDENICTHCGMCFRACPAEAILWKKKEVARIDKDKCVKCLTCYDRCKFGAIF
jgi:NADH:ubiquinone oxidoreductase subunit F (NADH-binding)/(2Fe-2S) ferredoxin/NAD-dependent dihydropyrimidine dehydrogenase PreA subunit